MARPRFRCSSRVRQRAQVRRSGSISTCCRLRSVPRSPDAPGASTRRVKSVDQDDDRATSDIRDVPHAEGGVELDPAGPARGRIARPVLRGLIAVPWSHRLPRISASPLPPIPLHAARLQPPQTADGRRWYPPPARPDPTRQPWWRTLRPGTPRTAGRELKRKGGHRSSNVHTTDRTNQEHSEVNEAVPFRSSGLNRA